MSRATVRENVLLACRAHGLPIEFAIYFLTMIKLAGGDDSVLASGPDEFMAFIVQIGKELDTPISVEEVPREFLH